MKKLSIIVALMVAGLFCVSSATADNLPSSKATFAYSNLVALESGCDNTAGCPADSGWTTILAAQIKMANQKDLFIDTSLQCGIVTDTTVKSMGGLLDKSQARATVTVRIKLTAPDGETVTYAEPSSGIDATGIGSFPVEGIVFCDRIQELSAKFAGLTCTADANGVVTCEDPEELQLILKTLNANSFNFVAANLSSGVYTIEVQARTSANVELLGEGAGLAAANAFIGAGSVAIEAVRMIQGNDGTTLEF